MKILIDEEVVKQALDALEAVSYVIDPSILPKQENMVMYAITALRSALQADTKVEPVAWMSNDKSGGFWFQTTPPHQSKEYKFTPLYTAPTPPTNTDGDLAWYKSAMDAVADIPTSTGQLEKFFKLDDDAHKAGLIGNTDELREAARAVVEQYDSNDGPWFPGIDRLRKALK